MQGGSGDQDKKVAHVTQEFSTVARNQFLAPPRSLNSFGAEFVQVWWSLREKAVTQGTQHDRVHVRWKKYPTIHKKCVAKLFSERS